MSNLYGKLLKMEIQANSVPLPQRPARANNQQNKNIGKHVQQKQQIDGGDGGPAEKRARFGGPNNNQNGGVNSGGGGGGPGGGGGGNQNQNKNFANKGGFGNRNRNRGGNQNRSNFQNQNNVNVSTMKDIKHKAIHICMSVK